MSTEPTTRRATASYTRPTTREEIVAEAIGCIISGRPLPEYLRAPTLYRARPATVEEGCARILTGAAPRG
jgi:hypothetical protein